MRHLLPALLFMLSAVAPTADGAMRVQLLVSSADEPYATTADALADQLARRTLTIERAPLEGWRPDPEVDLVVALGTRATHAALQATPRRPVIAALLPRAAWDAAQAEAATGPATALWLDQPPARQLRLLRLVAPSARRVGALLDAADDGERAGLERAARAAGLELRLRTVAPGDDPAVALGALLTEVDAVLALPAPAIWNRVTVQPLLLATFRAGAPVIGFSPTYVRAGAIAAAHSTPAQVAGEVAELVAAFDPASPALPPPRHPRRFEVVTNPEVARALGIALGDPAGLAERLRRAEDGP